MTIADIQKQYQIKRPRAYKWRRALVNAGLEVNQENLDKIKSGKINLTKALNGTLEIEDEIEDEIENEIEDELNQENGKNHLAITTTPSTNITHSQAEKEVINTGEFIPDPEEIDLAEMKNISKRAKSAALVKAQLTDFYESQIEMEKLRQETARLNAQIEQLKNLTPQKFAELLSQWGIK